MFRLVILLATAVLAGCATSYQSSDLTGGFSDEHVAEDVYRASELALQKGFDEFEILSPIALGRADSRSDTLPVAFIFIPMPGNESRKPSFEADIRLLKGPINANPPKVFDARALKTALEPYVIGEKKCDRGNVCPHIKKYLQPVPANEPASAEKST